MNEILHVLLYRVSKLILYPKCEKKILILNYNNSHLFTHKYFKTHFLNAIFTKT